MSVHFTPGGLRVRPHVLHVEQVLVHLKSSPKSKHQALAESLAKLGAGTPPAARVERR